MSTVTRQDIYSGVQEVLVEALGADEREVTERARVRDDLGAESIDYLDIVFRLEQTFKIKIPRGELFPVRDGDENERFYAELPRVPDNPGRLNAEGVAALRERHAHIDWSGLSEEPYLTEVGARITVGSILNYVERKLGEENE